MHQTGLNWYRFEIGRHLYQFHRLEGHGSSRTRALRVQAKKIPMRTPGNRIQISIPLCIYTTVRTTYYTKTKLLLYLYAVFVPELLLQTPVIYKSVFHYTSGMCRSSTSKSCYTGVPHQRIGEESCLSIYISMQINSR